MVRSKLVEATSGLADYRTRQEQFYQDNRNYGTAGGACGIPGPVVTRYFTITCLVGASNQAYTITASHNANQGLGAANSMRSP